MAKSALLALVSICAVGVALVLGPDIASATDDCVTASNLVPPKCSCWYYHVDRATNRHGWYLAACPAVPAGAQRKSTQSEHAQTGGRVGHQLSESEQAALFFQVLGWSQRQSAADTRTAEPPWQTVSP
jgi:hypothetical protein